MALTPAEKQRRYRERKRDAAAAAASLRSVPESGPGAVELALELFLSGLDGPDPLLAEAVRGLARRLDGDMPGHPAVTAELRRTRGQLAKDDAVKRAGAGEKLAGGRARPVNPVAQMSRSYAKRFGSS